MKFNYLCQSLSQPRDPLLRPEKTVFNRRPRIFVLPKHVLESRQWLKPSLHKQLVQLTKKRKPNPFLPESWQARKNSYTVLSDNTFDYCRPFAEALCRQENQGLDVLYFITGPVFRFLNNKISVSHVLFDSYMIWDQGEEGEWPAKTEPSALERAWRGAGWLSLALRQNCGQISNECFDRHLHNIDNRATEIANNWMATASSPPARSSLFPIEPKRQVAYRMARYLPSYRVGNQRRLYVSNMEAGLRPWHGPLPWQRWYDPNLDDLEQDLVFESWLVPFQGQTGWTLQPASLILLYWAGGVLEFWDPMPDPQSFLDRHDWSGWFGGRL